MESDSLLPVSNDVSPRKNSGSDGNGNATIGQLCRQTLATWALAVALTILAVVLLVDIPLRAMHGNDHVAASTTAATDSYTVIATSQVSASSVISSPSQRYHGTQFISFTINTLGGLAEYGECEGRSVDPNSNSCYLGNDDIEADVNHRLGILEEVLFTLRCVMFLHTHTPSVVCYPTKIMDFVLNLFSFAGHTQERCLQGRTRD